MFYPLDQLENLPFFAPPKKADEYVLSFLGRSVSGLNLRFGTSGSFITSSSNGT